MPALVNPAPRGWVSQEWKDGSHRGRDYGFLNANEEATDDVHAAADGVVESVYTGSGANGGWGRRVVIDHGYGVKTTYNHFEPGGIRVSRGQRVTAGQYIGEMGRSGRATGKHLHFELLVNGTRVDPKPYFSRALPNIPTPATVGKVTQTNQRKAIARSNRRAAPLTSATDLGNDLLPGAVGNFVGFIRGDSVGGNNIWFKGHSGHYFHSSAYEGGGKNTAGLKDLGTWAKAPAAAKPAARAHVRIDKPWVVYGTEHEAYHAINKRGTVPANDYVITNYGNDGKPVQIQAPGQEGVRHAGRYWIGSAKTAAPVVWK